MAFPPLWPGLTGWAEQEMPGVFAQVARRGLPAGNQADRGGASAPFYLGGVDRAVGPWRAAIRPGNALDLLRQAETT